MHPAARDLANDALMFLCGIGFLIGLSALIVAGVVRLVWRTLLTLMEIDR